MVILVLNCGSSSIKYQVLDVQESSQTLLAKGLVERIGIEGSNIAHKKGGDKIEINLYAGTVNLCVDEIVMEEIGGFEESIRIGNCCYQVGAEVYNEFVTVSKEYSAFFSPDGEKFKLDLVKANKFNASANIIGATA